MKFDDLNANGAKDAGEPGLAGWTISAYVDANGNGTRDAGENRSPRRTTTTPAACTRCRLNPGQVRRVRGAAGRRGPSPTRPAPRACSAANVARRLGGITLGLGLDRLRQRLRELPQGTKTGTKFNDLNGNGAKDAGEPGSRGWTISAYDDANGERHRDAGETRSPPRT